MKATAALLCLAALVYCGILAAAKLFANALMFHPPARTYVKTRELSFFEMPDGTKLAALMLKSGKSDAPKIFYCHGNGEDLGLVRPGLEELRKRGFDVFSYDYCGYGFSEGRPTEKNLYESAEAAWNYAAAKFGYTPENTVLFGFSLGSAAVCAVAEKRDGWRGIILAGGIANGAKTTLPIDIIPWKILDNSSKVAEFKCPLLILHGTRDAIVAPRNARENFAAAKCPKKLVWLKGYGHNNISSSPEYAAEVENFIKNPKL